MIVEYIEQIASSAGAIAAGMIGTMMKRAHLTRENGKPFWTRDIFIEIPIAIGMGIIGAGVAEMMALSGMPAAALTAMAGYLGPPAIDWVFKTAVDRKLK